MYPKSKKTNLNKSGLNATLEKNNDMKNLINYLCIMCFLVVSCKHEGTYYNPDVIINESGIECMDSVSLHHIRDISNMVYGLYSIDNYLILIQNNRDTLFQVFDMRNDSLIASFGKIGHAHNEFRRVPVKAYCTSNKKGNPILCVQEEACTKFIDIKESVETNKCVIAETIKDNKDFAFYYTFHIGNNKCFNYKTVSYEDARDHIYIKPMFYMNDSSEKGWDIFPQIITPTFSSLVDCAYLMKVLVSPNGKYVVGINQLIDIVTIFDLSKDKTIGIINLDSYTLEKMEREFNEDNFDKKVICFNISGCTSDNSFFVLKDGDLYENVALNENEDGYSVVSRYDWSGNKLTSYVLDKKLIYIAYNKNTDILYAISAADRLYSFKLR